MSHFYTTELGRMRTDEAIARAERYRRIQQAQHRNTRDRMSRPTRFVYRRALAAVGLSALVVVGLASAALAYPVGPGTTTGSDIVADRTHPQVKGVRPGVELSTYAQVREATHGTTAAPVPSTWAQAREATPVLRGGPTLSTFAQAREATRVATAPELSTFAQAREAAPSHTAAGIEDFVASGYYVPAPVEPYVALGSSHNTDAVEHMMAAPSVADTGVKVPHDSGISTATIAAIATLLLLVGGGVMVAVRHRELPRAV
jgi:hypothetical protein